MEHMINDLHLTGKLANTPEVGHEAFGEVFYYLTLDVPRLSGTTDLLPITISERLMEEKEFTPGTMLSLEGQVRSYNKVVDGAGRLLITAFAQRLVEPDPHRNPNILQLTGTLCKPPAYRTTPFGREIADLMLAVNRAYGKSDYIPCITWGRSARFASRLHVGDRVCLVGRLQSRAYQKQLPDGGVIEKVAYEVSVSQIELASTPETLAAVRHTLPSASLPGAAPASMDGVEGMENMEGMESVNGMENTENMENMEGMENMESTAES